MSISLIAYTRFIDITDDVINQALNGLCLVFNWLPDFRLRNSEQARYIFC